jgi:organic radical activating enzyme
MLKEKQCGIQILTPCTLNCKLCAEFTPIVKKMGRHYTATFEQVAREVDALFEIYDYIENVTVSGGEPILHKQLFEICEYILKYKDKFDDCRIFSNGTLMPEKRIIELIKASNGKLKLVIDHYGDSLSARTWEIKSLCDNNGIDLRINMYCGDEPYCGGWIDVGNLSEHKNDTKVWLQKMVKECHNANWKNLLLFNGQLHRCTNSSFGAYLGFYVPKDDEYIDVLDDSTSLEEKRNKAANFASRPMTSCEYCNGFNPETSARFIPAEQLDE